MANEKKSNMKVNRGGVKFLDSIKTRLIAIMIMVAAVPLIVAVIVSYVTSSNKALSDAQDSLQWQCRYIQDKFVRISEMNMTMIRSIADDPTVVQYILGAAGIPEDAVLNKLAATDAIMDDGDTTVITGADGMQLLRCQGKLVDVKDREYFQEAIKGNLYVSNVISNKTTGMRMITFACPIKDGDKIIGIVQRNYNLSNFHEMLAAESEDAFLVDRSCSSSFTI